MTYTKEELANALEQVLIRQIKKMISRTKIIELISPNGQIAYIAQIKCYFLWVLPFNGNISYNEMTGKTDVDWIYENRYDSILSAQSAIEAYIKNKLLYGIKRIYSVQVHAETLAKKIISLQENENHTQNP